MQFFRRLAPVKAFSFDLDDTFYDNHPYIVEAEKQLFAFMTTQWPQVAELGRPAWRRFRARSIVENPLYAHDMIALRKSVLDKMFSAIGLQGEDLRDAAQQSYDVFYFHRSNFVVNPEYVALLQELAAKYPVIAITNGNVDIARVGLKDCFHHVFHASTVLRSKPYRDMFDAASKACGVAPRNILHVGDNLEKDVGGAIKAGFQAAWYAENRPMNLNHEATQQLPHVALGALAELKQLV
ncbi:HAD-IA family hydrolase [Planctobacterium marinum]|uniref:Haloacid dehalogenase n=1 Tax=Planctobacterium marinum TaxID=1631968 RepID=A0AA48KP10_9ALTE|nr:haloacid dehalogenase [Planctobacterium marinum]